MCLKNHGFKTPKLREESEAGIVCVFFIKKNMHPCVFLDLHKPTSVKSRVCQRNEDVGITSSGVKGKDIIEAPMIKKQFLAQKKAFCEGSDYDKMGTGHVCCDFFHG